MQRMCPPHKAVEGRLTVAVGTHAPLELSEYLETSLWQPCYLCVCCLWGQATKWQRDMALAREAVPSSVHILVPAQPSHGSGAHGPEARLPGAMCLTGSLHRKRSLPLQRVLHGPHGVGPQRIGSSQTGRVPGLLWTYLSHHQAAKEHLRKHSTCRVAC